jgi:hypothetical protein
VNVEDLLAEVEALGVTVDLDGDVLTFRPGSALPPRLVEELRGHKPELLELVSLRGWPEESRDAVRRHCRPEARLYPLVGHEVETPEGDGRLVAVFPDRAAVTLDYAPDRLVYLLPSEVLPPCFDEVPGQPFEAVH